MSDGLKFFIGVLVATLIGAVAMGGAVKVRDAQNNTILKAEQKANQLLQ